jgi:acetyl-CoA acetyltransferase
MNTFSKAYVPYNGYYSTPFCRWQGSLQNENAIELGAKTARNWFLHKKIDPTIIDYLYFGITIHQHHLFYSHNWAAGLLTDNKKNLPGLMINQACTTSTTIINLAALAVEQGAIEVGFGLMADRCSNGAHTVWTTLTATPTSTPPSRWCRPPRTWPGK